MAWGLTDAVHAATATPAVGVTGDATNGVRLICYDVRAVAAPGIEGY